MSKALTIYFSRAGKNWSNGRVINIEKGNTEIAAEYVHAAVGGEIFRVDPVDAYPDDYYACSERARKEFDEAARPTLKSYISAAGYDIIYVCYPNWFGTMPMPMFSALEKLDLKGKKIAPLCTNEGSGLGESERDLERLFPGAELTEGLSVHGTGAAACEAIISAWAKRVAEQ